MNFNVYGRTYSADLCLNEKAVEELAALLVSLASERRTNSLIKNDKMSDLCNEEVLD
jgi:hypothetical protein